MDNYNLNKHKMITMGELLELAEMEDNGMYRQPPGQ